MQQEKRSARRLPKQLDGSSSEHPPTDTKQRCNDAKRRLRNNRGRKRKRYTNGLEIEKREKATKGKTNRGHWPGPWELWPPPERPITISKPQGPELRARHGPKRMGVVEIRASCSAGIYLVSGQRACHCLRGGELIGRGHGPPR